jgi:hypothetical protein
LVTSNNLSSTCLGGTSLLVLGIPHSPLFAMLDLDDTCNRGDRS